MRNNIRANHNIAQYVHTVYAIPVPLPTVISWSLNFFKHIKMDIPTMSMDSI